MPSSSRIRRGVCAAETNYRGPSIGLAQQELMHVPVAYSVIFFFCFKHTSTAWFIFFPKPTPFSLWVSKKTPFSLSPSPSARFSFSRRRRRQRHHNSLGGKPQFHLRHREGGKGEKGGRGSGGEGRGGAAPRRNGHQRHYHRQAATASTYGDLKPEQYREREEPEHEGDDYRRTTVSAEAEPRAEAPVPWRREPRPCDPASTPPSASPRYRLHARRCTQSRSHSPSLLGFAARPSADEPQPACVVLVPCLRAGPFLLAGHEHRVVAGHFTAAHARATPSAHGLVPPRRRPRNLAPREQWAAKRPRTRRAPTTPPCAVPCPRRRRRRPGTPGARARDAR